MKFLYTTPQHTEVYRLYLTGGLPRKDALEILLEARDEDPASFREMESNTLFRGSVQWGIECSNPCTCHATRAHAMQPVHMPCNP